MPIAAAAPLRDGEERITVFHFHEIATIIIGEFRYR